METLNIKVVNPKVKMLLQHLAEMNLISIKSTSSLPDMLEQLRENEAQIPSPDEITQEVESVRQNRYDRKLQGNY